MREHESLRKALRWLTEQACIDRNAIAEASNHFDLSPLDEQFLRDYFLGRGTPGPSKMRKMMI
ncbi:hypothetical protein MBH78_22705 [Oceanimonas sp. NS1]|nr:hypothetical protein [Oceanimonas sp. NS1]